MRLKHKIEIHNDNFLVNCKDKKNPDERDIEGRSFQKTLLKNLKWL